MAMKIFFWLAIMLCGIGICKVPTDGQIYINAGGYVKFNGEVVAKIKGNKLAYSIKNGLLSIAATEYNKQDGKHTIMYVIDLKSKSILKEEKLAYNTYKDSDIELSLTENKYAVVMHYTRNGETHKVVLPREEGDDYEFTSFKIYYISQNGYIVIHDLNYLYVFSMDTKKFTYLGKVYYNNPGFTTSACSGKCDGFNKGWYIPFNEYVIYSPEHTSIYNMNVYPIACSGKCDGFNKGWYIPFNEYIIYSPEHTSIYNMNVYLYRYSDGALYATRYKNKPLIAKDTIEQNINKGNIYEQFLPLTKVENMDSITNVDIKKIKKEEEQKYLDSLRKEKEKEKKREDKKESKAIPEKNMVAEMVEAELSFAQADYFFRFKKSISECDQCSNLEKLMLLERALRTNIDYSKNIKDMQYFKNKEKDLKMNSFKELIEMDGKEYFYIKYLQFTRLDYKLIKAVSGYEMLFNKRLYFYDACPNRDAGCSFKENLEHINRAIEAESVILDYEEEANIKTEYENRFGKPISEIEFSTSGFYFQIGKFEAKPLPFYISVSRTATGAVARYVPPIEVQQYIEPHELKLSMNEWLDLVKSLHECQISEWKKTYGVDKRGVNYENRWDIRENMHEWEFRMFFSDRDKSEYSGIGDYPPNWKKFKKIMEDIEERLRSGKDNSIQK